MRKRLWRVANLVVLAAVVVALGVTLEPQSRTSSPYLSALSDLAGSPAFAASKKTCRSMCEFVAPAFTCLGEAIGSRCVRTSSGCTTEAC